MCLRPTSLPPDSMWHKPTAGLWRNLPWKSMSPPPRVPPLMPAALGSQVSWVCACRWPLSEACLHMSVVQVVELGLRMPCVQDWVAVDLFNRSPHFLTGLKLQGATCSNNKLSLSNAISTVLPLTQLRWVKQTNAEKKASVVSAVWWSSAGPGLTGAFLQSCSTLSSLSHR